MRIGQLYTPEEITELAKKRFEQERAQDFLTGWFLAREKAMECDQTYRDEPDCIRIAHTLQDVAAVIPLNIRQYHVFAGTQDDAFARSYALINPSFEVASFTGYCDPVAVFGDIEPIGDITQERIDRVRDYYSHTEFAKRLTAAYEPVEKYTHEAVFFVEQVTGHVVPDVRELIAKGAKAVRAEIEAKAEALRAQAGPAGQTMSPEAGSEAHSGADRTGRTAGAGAGEEAAVIREQLQYCQAMELSLDALLALAARYRALALEMAQAAEKGGASKDQARYELMAATLERVPAEGARDLFEAIQSFILIWQLMTLEQTPNPYAFSVGNADRIFEPYRAKEDTDRAMSAALLKHLLVFFNVADRSWAISQNLIIGGRDLAGRDLTNETSYALLDAYFDMNLPQPILSVKLHQNTPDELYAALGRFFFTPGVLTPSLFNDDAMFEVLRSHGVEEDDLPDYSVAGCQEPLIMGKDNGNTTNSWLNLPKVLELVLQNGVSEITGEKLGRSWAQMGYEDSLSVLRHIREIYYRELDYYIDEMAAAANRASYALSLYQVPFLSCMMGGIGTATDMRDTRRQGTKYNGSGCLIHGLSVLADSFTAIDTLLEERPEDADRMLSALRDNFEHDEEMHQYLLACDKYGNNKEGVDREAAEIASKVADMVSARKNYLDNPFRPDFSSPSTHLMYGYWVGATPDGRTAREELNYGVDPLFGEASGGLGTRMLSNRNLPFAKMNGGYASHFGINPGYFKGSTMEEKGLEFKQKIFAPLFFNAYDEDRVSAFYLYVNVTTPQMLRAVLAEPKKYAPSGVYIVRIHGTFVNFLDLSPDIQEDIIKRLDPESTALE